MQSKHTLWRMVNKLKKYITYVFKFLKSPKKFENIHNLIKEIQDKGIIKGTQSILHQKTAGFNPDNDELNAYQTPCITNNYTEYVPVSLPETTAPEVSIIIPCYNQLHYTYNCIRSIAEQISYKNYEIIIADDKSPEDTSILKDLFPNAIYRSNPENLGFLRNCNDAAKLTKGKYIVLLNNDTQVQKFWLEELLQVFEKWPNVGLVGSKLIYPNGALQEAGGVIWQDGSAMNYGNSDHPNRPQYNYIKESDYISGASVMVPRKLWEEMGGFDELYAPAYNEDVDLCFEVRKRGYKTLYTPFSRVVHFEGISHGTDVRKGVKKYQVINKEKFQKKWAKELALRPAKDSNIFVARERYNGPKTVLIIDHNVPTIDKDAGSRCISNFIDVLLSMNCRVKIMVPRMVPFPNYMEPLQRKGVEVLSGEAYLHDLHLWEDFFKKNITFFDAILLSRSSICIPYIKHLNKLKYAGPTIYFGHDLGYLRLEQELKLKNDSFTKKLYKKTKAEEEYMYANSQHALMISHDELQYLQGKVKSTLHYIPLCYFDVAPTPSYKERTGLLFVGGFQHPPNWVAMQWFLDEIYPSLQATGIPMHIVGSEMPEEMYAYKQKFPSLRISPNATVAELQQYYNEAKISVVPLLSGAGVKGKVIEAMALGVPLVGTSSAYQGLYKDETFVYQPHDTVATFIENVLATYQSEELWQSQSTFGKAYVQKYYNKELMEKVFSNILSLPTTK